MILDGQLKAVIFHVPNEFSGTKAPIFGMVQKAMGVIPGAPDYIVMKNGKGMAFEFKVPGGRLSEKQKAFKEWCEDSGVEYHIFTSADDAIQKINSLQP